MALTEDLISQFVKATKDETEPAKEEVVYGTIVEKDGYMYIRIDGSEILTPIVSTTNVVDGERVTAMIKNHTITVTGNLSSPSARTAEVKRNADQIELRAFKDEPSVGVKTTTVTVDAEGVKINTGGTFTVDSGNFELDSNGNMSAENAYMSGSIYVNGFPALSQYDLHVGTNPPSEPHSRMLWVKPDTSTSASTTLSHKIAWDSRQTLSTYPKTGELKGTATEAVGSIYTYQFKIPIFLREYASQETGGTIHFEIMTELGGDPVLAISKDVSISSLGSGNRVVDVTITDPTWIGNYSTLYFRLYATRIYGYYLANVLNSSDASASITLTCNSKSDSGASGWLECKIYSYA